jgi:preprotein translocase subunit SecF
MRENLKQNLTKFHDKNYKLLLLIPAVVLLFGLIYMVIFYSQTGDFMNRDISLTGGTSVTIYEKLTIPQIEADLSGELNEVDVREVYDLITREHKAIIIETKSDAQTTRQVLEDYLGYELNEENSSFEFTGSSLSKSFFKQLIIAIILAFLFMALVVFIMFRSVVPSTAIILSAFADIFMTLVFFNILGLKMSSAGIIAFLMLIGYSVDTDILLTNRVLKRHGESLNRKLWGSLKTGMTMTLTSLLAIAFALVIIGAFSAVLKQIFTILVIGLSFDIFNTWIMNASIIKWYAISKNKNED